MSQVKQCYSRRIPIESVSMVKNGEERLLGQLYIREEPCSEQGFVQYRVTGINPFDYRDVCYVVKMKQQVTHNN